VRTVIHSEHPFAPDPADRDLARRFRGRLAAGVTIVTAGGDSNWTGLTVSSLLVVQGEPAQAQLVVGPTTDLWETAAESGHFIIHICRDEDRRLADVFAGLWPSPGGIFTGLPVAQSQWGPVLTDLPDRAYCRYQSRVEVGWSGVVVGLIEQVEVSDLQDPMIHFRSGYRRLHSP
jgi:3-hydroxy-9,10-secoandrosta-1,3,5(10)-triene-9,17-dione monooxygenase reductase component